MGFAIGLEPKAAVSYLRSMGVAVASDWRSAEAAARQHAIAISGVTQLSVTRDIHAGLIKAMAKGQSAAQFVDELQPKLKAAGWWGKNARLGKGAVDATTGEIAADGKGLTHSRLKFIYREHMASAYAAAKETQAVASGATRWQYSAILDSRTRPAHRALHGRIFRMDDAGANAVKPRNGFGCRCNSIYYYDDPSSIPATPLAQTRKVNVPAPGGGERSVTELIDKSLPDGRFRPDPGFDQAPGADWQRALSRTALDKASELPPELGALAAYRHLQRPAVVDELTQAWQSFAKPMIPRSAADVIKPRGELFYVGALFPDVTAAAQANGVVLQTAVISILDRQVAHMLRTAKKAPLPEDWLMGLPAHLFEGPRTVTLDRGRLVLWFDLPGQAGKLALSLNETVKLAAGRRVENLIESGGVLDEITSRDVLAKARVIWSAQ